MYIVLNIIISPRVNMIFFIILKTKPIIYKLVIRSLKTIFFDSMTHKIFYDNLFIYFCTVCKKPPYIKKSNCFVLLIYFKVFDWYIIFMVKSVLAIQNLIGNNGLNNWFWVTLWYKIWWDIVYTFEYYYSYFLSRLYLY